MKTFAKKLLYHPLFLVLLVLILWQAVYEFSGCSDLFFPNPKQVMLLLYNGFLKTYDLWFAIGISIKRLVIGYLLTLLIGIPLGMLCHTSEILRATLGKIAIGFQTLPSICWVPLTLLWFGQSDTAIIFVICMGSLWSLILGTMRSIQLVPHIYIRAAYTMGARGFTLWQTVIFPAALPYLVNVMKQSWAFAWRSLLSAEIYISTISGLGLGQLLHYGREMQSMDQVISIIIILIFLGLLIDRYIFLPIEKSIEKRWGK